MRETLYILSLLLIIFSLGCGAGFNEGEDYGDLLASPEGLILTPSEHEGGWGRADCTFCHQLNNIHLVNRTSSPDINVDQIRWDIEQVVLAGGNPDTTCATCHGYNGLVVVKTLP